MQPYFFPYWRYYFLAFEVDTFVFLDDVNFQKKGFIHRNFLFDGEGPTQINLRLHKSSQNKKINQLVITDKKTDVLRKIDACYSSSPYYKTCNEFLTALTNLPENSLSEYLIALNTLVFDALGIDVEIKVSSKHFQKGQHTGQDRILSILNSLKATKYINLPGGKGLYNAEVFHANGIELNFLDYGKFNSNTPGSNCAYNLSIIDFLMYNPGQEFSQFIHRS